jgi:2,4-dienoyl-CoA reductase-like NADH-dependent reductase (Old Yellow Enzyme family)
MHTDDVIHGLQAVTRAVHAAGAPIFAQLNHAGSQSRLNEVDRLAPSAIMNPQTGRMPRVASDEEIWAIIEAFGQAAGRAQEAGFDGVHLHAGHGYVLSEFLSPHTNRRSDTWGGSLLNRQRFLMAVVQAIRSSVAQDFPVTVKLGVQDFVVGGLPLEEGLDTAGRLAAAGIDAIEVSAGLTTPKIESVIQYAGLTRRRALQDKLFHRVFSRQSPEAYFGDAAAHVKRTVTCPVILVGGLRSIETMESFVGGGQADFVSLARPFIRESDLVAQVLSGRRGFVDCTSCNICQQHDGVHSLRCWRKTNRRLLLHAFYRLTNQTNHT